MFLFGFGAKKDHGTGFLVLATWEVKREPKNERRGKGRPNILNWSIMTASNVGAQTQVWQAKWVVFKIPGFVYKRFLPFFPIPFLLFYSRHFSRGLWLLFLILCSKTARKRWLCRLLSKRFATLWHSVSMYSDHNGSKWVGGRVGTHWHWSENSKVRIWLGLTAANPRPTAPSQCSMYFIDLWGSF